MFDGYRNSLNNCLLNMYSILHRFNTESHRQDMGNRLQELKENALTDRNDAFACSDRSRMHDHNIYPLTVVRYFGNSVEILKPVSVQENLKNTVSALAITSDPVTDHVSIVSKPGLVSVHNRK